MSGSRLNVNVIKAALSLCYGAYADNRRRKDQELRERRTKSRDRLRAALAEQHGFLVDPLLYIDNPVETLIRDESNPSNFREHLISRRIAGVNHVCRARAKWFPQEIAEFLV